MESPIYFDGVVARYARLYSLYVTRWMLDAILATFIEWREAGERFDLFERMNGL